MKTPLTQRELEAYQKLEAAARELRQAQDAAGRTLPKQQSRQATGRQKQGAKPNG